MADGSPVVVRDICWHLWFMREGPSLRSLLIPPDDDQHEKLEAFIGAQLAQNSIWSSPRCSDGVSSCFVVADIESRLCVCGRIWEIDDQTLHTFWLEVEAEPTTPSCVSWTLRYDAKATSSKARRLAETPGAMDRPDQLEWRHTLTGSAAARDGVLVATP
jgi:hypothetical protein